MFKIKPLNRESISDDGDDAAIIRKEAQEENALAKYNKALKFQCNNNYEDAKDLLQSLIEKDIPEIENRGGLPKTMSTLKYSCYLNIGTINSNLGKKQEALDNYAQASDLDKTDVTLWFKIGKLALELDHFKQSAYALSKGLECNKRHWPCLDTLITLLYAMRDTISCLFYISRALQIDPDYIRGLMLRKKIYENNPGTKDYYQLFNPDCIYDPPFEVQFDEVEGKELEKESNEIFQRIRQLEIALEPKPLPVLQLSKLLEEFTWIALGESIIHMHRHISEEKLSFISRITLSENIKSNHSETDSQEKEKTEVIPVTAQPEDISNINNNPQESENKINEAEKDLQMEIETIDLESDIASEVPEANSDDTENEEKNNEQEVEIEEENLFPINNSKSNSQEGQTVRESQEEDPKSESDNMENKDYSSSKSQKSDNKNESVTEEKSKRTPNRRRRNSLSFLQPWAWHSKRKSSRKMGKNDKDDSIEGALRRIIPNNLLPNGLKSDKYKKFNAIQQDDSLNTMDLYKLFIEEHEQNTDTEQIKTIDKNDFKTYFGTQEEKEDVQRFWKYDYERCDIIALLEKYVITLAGMWEIKWPKKLKTIYIETYEMYRQHFDHPQQLFSNEFEFSELRIDAEITLLYGELIFDEVQERINKSLSLQDIKTLASVSLTTMEIICTRKTDWGSDYLKMNLRLHWLKSNIYMAENKNDLAIRSLHSILYFIANFVEEKDQFYLQIPNCNYNSLITLSNTEKLLQSLEMIQNLHTVEKLYENKCYNEVIAILQDCFKLKSVQRNKSKIDRPIQIIMLLHALWLSNRQECLIWSDICLNDSLPNYFKTYAQPDSFEHKRWSLIVVKCMVMMEACIKEENIIVLDYLKETQVRLVENLTSIICHQLNAKTLDTISKMPLESVKPWILLHYILQREEHRVQAKRRNVKHCKNSDDSDGEQNISPNGTKSDDSEEDDEQDVPASIQILFSAHDFLGRKSWCLESNGEILLFIVDVILYRLNAPIFEGIREKIDIHLEQAFFCLYQHPSKKNKVSRHLADHNVDPLSLSWEHAQKLYEFYQPKALPEFDSYRFSSISNEMEQLLQRILALVPPNYDPNTILPQVTKFLNGDVEKLPEPLEFPFKVAPIYYLLGDYYLKQHDPTKGLKYFLLDLCINPTRLDTWADMALAMASQLETKLNYCEKFRNESEFFDKAKSAQICFKQSLKISSNHAMLWIEYGNFVYMAHSFCSRLLKGDTDMFSMEKFEALESQKESLLDTANECFTAASVAWCSEPGEHDERWLHHYMLGKIAEKKKQDPSVYLDHYNKAAKLLFENKAAYPLKINYSNPQHLSVEALEIHYRIHASILKYLELHEDKPLSRNIGRIFQKYLKECDNGLFSKPVPLKSSETQNTDVNLKRVANDTTDQPPAKKKRMCDASILEDVATVIEEMMSKVEEETKEVVVVLDSDDETTPSKSKSTPEKPVESSKYPKIRVKNAQEIMDDLMKKCIENQPEYKSETETDAEMDIEKTNENNKVNTTADNNPSSPSRRGSTTSTAATTTTTSDSSDSSSSDESSDSSSDSESSETESSKQSNISGKKSDNLPLTTEEIKKLIDQCLLALEQCMTRFSQNYKAIFRLTHFYLNNKTHRNLNKCRQLMLSEYHCADTSIVAGLFADRRNNNFFNGVWRIPTSEIDRPGSFAQHMSRCVQLLMQVLRDSDDHKTLLDLCLLLRRTPDPDKIYIRESERQQLSDQALLICIQSFRGIIKRLTSGKQIYNNEASNTQEGDSTIKLLMDLYKAYLKVQKHLVHKESVFAGLLTEAYKHYMVQNKLSESANVLEAAIKFCQTKKIASRMIVTPVQSPTIANMKQQQATNSPSSAQTPSLPSTSVPPLKRSSKVLTSRPRGRPPNINKHLSGVKARSRDSNIFSTPNPYSWQNVLYPSNLTGNIDPKVALNYMMSKYQEEYMLKLMSNPYALNSMMSLSTHNFSTAISSTTNTTSNAPPSISSISKMMNPTKLPSTSKMLDPTKIQSTSKMLDPTKIPSTSKMLDPTKIPSTSKILDPTKYKQSSQSSTEKSTKTNDPNMRYTKEPNKGFYTEPSKISKEMTIKDRPGISITPLQTTTTITTSPSLLKPLQPVIPASPTKTLQQKLAERQKQNPGAQQSKHSSTSNKNTLKPDKQSSMDFFTQFQNFTQNISFAKPPPPPTVSHAPKLNIGNKISHPPKLQTSQSSSNYKTLQQSIPSSLTITKANTQSVLPQVDAGISISQITGNQTSLLKPDAANKLMNFRKPSAPKLKFPTKKLSNELTVTPNYISSEPKKDTNVNIPMSLSITKRTDTKKNDTTTTNIENDIEIIEIE